MVPVPPHRACLYEVEMQVQVHMQRYKGEGQFFEMGSGRKNGWRPQWYTAQGSKILSIVPAPAARKAVVAIAIEGL